MTIKYKLADGDVIEIDVTEEVADALKELDREENRIARGYTRHTLSLDAMLYDGVAMGEWDDLCENYVHQDLIDEMNDVLDEMSDKQRRRYYKWAMGMTIRQIASEEGTTQKSVYESIDLARKKLKKIF